MNSVRSGIPIANWKAGETFQGFLFLRRREARTDRSGKTYLELELSDASGSILARAWSDSAALKSHFAAPGFVKVRGTVVSYRGELQLKVDHCRAVRPEDREEGFDEGILIPTSAVSPEELLAKIRALLERELSRAELRTLVAIALEVHGPRLATHPAAKSIHHAYRGGLAEHTLSMLELAVAVANHYRELDRELLLVGVLFHDLGKILELEPAPAQDYTAVGRLVGHLVLGRDILRAAAGSVADFPAELLLKLEHLVLSHQGQLEFGSPVVPMIPEAVALHAIDDLDSKLAQLRAAAKGAGFVWVRGLDRWIWTGAQKASPEAEVHETENG